ncbi:hypothetical protein B0H13DRAFT_2659853 [Mycena leptocephala]|nr:hypothetical protein B0H13DRAFT_2659853 [Mycena leptocephala]
MEIARTRCTYIGSLRFTPHHPERGTASARPDHAATGRGSMPLTTVGPELRKGSAGHFRCSIHALFTPSTSSPRASSLPLPDLLRGWFCTTTSFFGRHGPRLIFAHAWYDTAGRGKLKIRTVLDSDPHVLYPPRIIWPPTLFTCDTSLSLPCVSPFLPSVLFLSRGTATPRLIHWLGSHSLTPPPPLCASSLPPSGLFLSQRFCDTSSSSRLLARSTLLNTLHLLSARLLPPAIGSLLPVVLRYLPIVSLGPRSLTPSSLHVSSLPLLGLFFSRRFSDTCSTLCYIVSVPPLLAVAEELTALTDMTLSFLPSSSSRCASSLPPSFSSSTSGNATPLPSVFDPPIGTDVPTFTDLRLQTAYVGRRWSSISAEAKPAHLHRSSPTAAHRPTDGQMDWQGSAHWSAYVSAYRDLADLCLWGGLNAVILLTTRRLPFPRLPPPAAGSPLTCGNATPYPRPFSDATLLLLPSLLRDSSIPTIPAIPLLGFDSLGVPLYQILRLYYPHALALPHLCIISFPLAFAVASLSFGCFPMFVWSCFRVSSRVVSACSVFCLSLASSAILLSAHIASIPGQVGHLCAGRDTHLYSRAKPSISSPFSSRVINCSIAQAANNYASKR